MTLLEPAALRADLHHRHVGGVVDEHGSFRNSTHLASKFLPVGIAHLTTAQIRQRDAGLSRQQTHRDFVAAHFKTEDGTRQPVLD